MTGVWQWLRIGLLSLFFLMLIWVGAKIGFQGLFAAKTAGQGIAAVTQIGYGFASGAVLWATWRDSWWLQLALYIWGALLIVTSWLAPMVWGGATWITGAFAAVVTSLVALLVGWGCEAHTRWYSIRNARRIAYYG